MVGSAGMSRDSYRRLNVRLGTQEGLPSEGSPWPSLSLFTVCLPRLDSCGRPSPAGVLSDEKGQPEQVFKNPSV